MIVAETPTPNIHIHNTDTHTTPLSLNFLRVENIVFEQKVVEYLQTGVIAGGTVTYLR